MPVQIRCAECGSSFRVKDEMIGRRVKCRSCGSPISVSRDERDAAAGSPYDAEFDDFASSFDDFGNAVGTGRMQPCPYCAEPIEGMPTECPYCGSDLTTTVPSRQVDRGARSRGDREKKEKKDSSDAIALFVTGLLGCFSPICAIFGTVFLVKRPYPFRNKGLAIAGTILHWFWTVVLIAVIVSRNLK